MENTDVQAPTTSSEYLVNAFKTLTNIEEAPRITLPIFLGGNDEIHRAITETAVAFITYGSAKEKGKEKEAKIFLAKFEELREEHFPDLNPNEVGAYCTVYLQFSRRYANRSIQRDTELGQCSSFINRIMTEVAGEDAKLIPYINPIIAKPRAVQAKRDRMRRRHNSGANQIADTFNVILHNSFVMMKISRPPRVELVNLINKIESQLRYFGERWVVNSINLERAGIARIIVEFMLDRVTYHSVEGILSPQELTEYILANDVDTMALALLEAASPKGVFYNMTCLANKCNHSSLEQVDPHDMYLLNDADMDDDQKDVMYDIVNKGRKLTPDELLTFQNRYKFKGVAIETAVKLHSELGGDESKIPYGQMTLGIPTMAEYFTTFDLMAEKYDPTFKKYALDYPDVQTYRKKRSEFAGAVRMGEYIHWVKEYVTYGDKQAEDSPDEVDNRGDDQRGYEEGLLDIFSDDDEAYWKTFGAIMEKTPYMSHVFIGFRNCECVKCGAKPGAKPGEDKPEEENGKVHPITLESGFTPIDVVTNFFDHTRMQIEEMGEHQRLQEEITS